MATLLLLFFPSSVTQCLKITQKVSFYLTQKDNFKWQRKIIIWNETFFGKLFEKK